MLLFELENAMIKPLSRADKFQLLLDITRMLQDEDRSETSIRSGVEYPVFTPTIAPVTPVPTATPMETPSAANGTLALTLDQLKQYDGKNGNSAYIAVDGVLYDVSGVRQWKNGSHEGYSAGKDLTDAIMGKSPHGTSVLDGVPIVGKLVAG